MKKLILSILILLTHSLPAQNTLLWEISGGGLEQKSYLYGTMHILCKDQVQFSDSVLAAMDSCEHLIFEMDDSKVGLLKQLKVLRMQGDTTLEQLLSEAEYQELATYLQSELNVGIKSLNRMKPMVISTLILTRQMPCSAREITGIEKELKKLGESRKMTVGELESFDQQSALLDSIPYAVQAAELMKTIRDTGTAMAEFARLNRLYQDEQLDSLLYLVLADTGFSAGIDDSVYLVRRNHNWIPILSREIHTQSCFIAVGAAHLPGENGLIALLRRHGYLVRPVFSEE